MEEGIRRARLIQKLVILGIFLVAGIGLLISSIFDMIGGFSAVSKSRAVDDSYAEVTAVISDIQVERTMDDESHTVYVTYTYEGQLYEDVKLNSYSSSMHEGGEIDILCNKENPMQIKSASTTAFLARFTWMFAGTKLIMAVIVLGVSISGIIKSLRKEPRI